MATSIWCNQTSTDCSICRSLLFRSGYKKAHRFSERLFAPVWACKFIRSFAIFCHMLLQTVFGLVCCSVNSRHCCVLALNMAKLDPLSLFITWMQLQLFENYLLFSTNLYATVYPYQLLFTLQVLLGMHLACDSNTMTQSKYMSNALVQLNCLSCQQCPVQGKAPGDCAQRHGMGPIQHPSSQPAGQHPSWHRLDASSCPAAANDAGEGKATRHGPSELGRYGASFLPGIRVFILNQRLAKWQHLRPHYLGFSTGDDFSC